MSSQHNDISVCMGVVVARNVHHMGIDMDTDRDSDMAVSLHTGGSFQRGLGLAARSLSHGGEPLCYQYARVVVVFSARPSEVHVPIPAPRKGLRPGRFGSRAALKSIV